MSSDTFSVRVLENSGRHLTWEVVPTTAGGLADIVCTRSFVVGVLGQRGVHAGPWHDVSWVQQHVDELVEATEVTRLVGIDRASFIADVSADYGVPVALLQPHIRLAITLAPGVTAPFAAGEQLTTTSYDVWWDDPKRPPLPSYESPVFPAALPEDFARRLETALRSLLPPPWRTVASEPISFEHEGVRFTVKMAPASRGPTYRPPGFNLGLKGTIPAVAGLAKKPPATPIEFFVWRRREFFVRFDDGQLEGPEAMAARIAVMLREDGERIAAHLSTAKAPGSLEARIAPFVPKGLMFSPLAPAQPLPDALDPILDHDVDNAFWKRALLFRLAGDDASARAARDQAMTKWKTVPAPYKALLASLT